MKKLFGMIAKELMPKSLYLWIKSVILSPKCDKRFREIKCEKDNLNQIVVIGDSHSRFFSGASVETEEPIHADINGIINYGRGDDKRFCAFDLGPALAYNLNKKGTTVRALEKYDWLSHNLMRTGDYLICAFGEIDIRAHVIKYVTDKNSLADIINNICDNYVEFLNIVEKDGYHPVVWGPIASQKDCWLEKASNPASGCEKDRNKAVELFNIRMEEECDKAGWGFMTIYKFLMEDYETKEEYIYDMCHLGNNAKELFEPEFARWKNTLIV